MSLQGFVSQNTPKNLGRAVVYELRARGGLSSNPPLLHWVPSSDPLTVCDRWRAHNYSLLGEIFRLEGHDQRWQVVGMASSGLDPRQHPRIMAVPFPSIGPTSPTTLDLRQARFGPHWKPLPQDLVLTVREGDDPPSGAGPRARILPDDPPAPVTVGAMEGDSDMDISEDNRPLPSSVGSCLQTHPPTHQEGVSSLSCLSHALISHFWDTSLLPYSISHPRHRHRPNKTRAQASIRRSSMLAWTSELDGKRREISAKSDLDTLTL